MPGEVGRISCGRYLKILCRRVRKKRSLGTIRVRFILSPLSEREYNKVVDSYTISD